MKRSKRSRSKNLSPNNSNNSTRKQNEPASIKGLVTSNQQSIKTQSQVSQYTHKTGRSNTFASSQQFQIADDELEKEEIHEVFINEQEQKVIQKILEVARKGKINQKNAFQIPLKVIDNQNFSIGKAKFWKFASQLLGASMSIYQKRIQNTWINTNLIHDKLARMITQKNTKQTNDDQNEQGMKKTESQFIMLPIEQFRDPKILDNIKLGQQTLESVAKINIPSFKKQFTDDPLFQRKLKTFDNTSIKGLLLNVFDLDSACQIQLFSSENKISPKVMSNIVKNQYSLPTLDKYIQKNIIQSKKHNKQQTIFTGILQFKKQNQIKDNNQQEIYDSIGFVKLQNAKSENPIFEELQAFLKQPIQVLQSQIPLYDDYFNNNTDSNEIKIIQQDVRTIPSQLAYDSQQHQIVSQFSQRTQNSPFNFFSEGPFSYQSDMDRSFHSVMTPWQIEFKQGKLRVKSKKKRNKKQTKKRQKVMPGVIQFDANQFQIRKKVIGSKKQKQTPISRNSKKGKNQYQNLIPPQLTVYEKVNYKKIVQLNKGNQNKQQDMHIKMQQNLPDFLAPDPSMMHQNLQQLNNMETQIRKSQINEDLIQNQHDILTFSNTKSKQTPMKKFNIRQTKKTIYEKVKEQRQLKISEIDMYGLTPASVLITFLHIANQKNMVVRNTSEQDDVILSWE